MNDTKGEKIMIKEKISSEKGFYIGDICYALKKEDYRKWGEAGYADGKIKIGDAAFVVASTAYGDGTYYGNNGVDYPVDAGNIGVVPLELVDNLEEKQKELWWNLDIHNTPGELLFKAGNGQFLIVLPNGEEIRIDTDDGEDWF